MPDVKSIETISYIFAFLVPGLIILFVRSQFITGRMPPHNEAILSYLVMTLVYYALAFPFLEYVLSVKEPRWWRFRRGSVL